MRMMRKRCFLLLLFVVAILFTQIASAVTETILPTSSYVDDDGIKWQGFLFYKESPEEDSDNPLNLLVRVDYAVYDTGQLSAGAEEDWVNGLDLEGQGQFLYAYQIFNDVSNTFDDVLQESEAGVLEFSVFAKDGSAMGLDESSIGSQDDGEGGIAPGDSSINEDNTEVTWQFNGDDGVLSADNHSYFLMFLSDFAPVSGDFTVEKEQPGGGAAPGVVPEPATVFLFGIGTLGLIRRRRKSV